MRKIDQLFPKNAEPSQKQGDMRVYFGNQYRNSHCKEHREIGIIGEIGWIFRARVFISLVGLE